MNSPLLDNPTILEESRIAHYAGFVKEAVNLVSFDQIEINVLGVSSEEQPTTANSVPGQQPLPSKIFTGEIQTTISPEEQAIIFPIEYGIGIGGTTGECELSTELILSYLNHAIDEQQLTIEYNMKILKIIRDIEELDLLIIELDEITKKNTLALEVQAQVIEDLKAAVATNSIGIADNADAIAILEDLVQRNINAIFTNAQNITNLQDSISRNTYDISVLAPIVTRNEDSIVRLESTIASNSSRISNNASSITDNENSIREVHFILDGLSDRIGANTDAIELLHSDFNGYKSIIDKNTQDISDIFNIISGEIAGIYQEGIGTDAEEIVLDFLWTGGKPYVDVTFAYGSSYVSTGGPEQEIICGHSGIFATANANEYKFTLFTGLYDLGTITDNAMNFTPPEVTANPPEGTVVYTDESVEQTTAAASAMLRIKGKINIANSGPAGSAGQITLQINVDNTEWVDIDTLFMYFSSTDTVGVDKVIDKVFTFGQTSHTYKLRGKLLLRTAPYANMLVNGSIVVDSVIESGTGAKLSSNVFATWIAKD
jgi:hypothetical protein